MQYIRVIVDDVRWYEKCSVRPRSMDHKVHFISDPSAIDQCKKYLKRLSVSNVTNISRVYLYLHNRMIGGHNIVFCLQDKFIAGLSIFK